MKWISVKNKLPEFGVDVLVYMAGTKNIYPQDRLDYSQYSNYEPQIMCMRLFQSKSAKQDSLNGIYWNFENKGNKISHRNERPEYSLITHWMPLPDAPKENVGMKGKKHSPETIEKIRAKQTGKKHSAETKQKMSEFRTHYHANLKRESL